MDGKLGTFLLGVIAAVVLVMLWKKGGLGIGADLSVGNGNGFSAGFGGGVGRGCSGASCGCGGSPGSCFAGAAGPAYQGSLAAAGIDGQISPGTPPLNAATGGQGATSFYSNAGVTPDTSFTFIPVQRNTVSVGSPLQPPVPNVPGSATTPAAVTPTRATQVVPTYAEQGFIQRYSVSGVYVH